MFQGIMAMAQFSSASSAALAYVMLGFVPDFLIFIQNHGGTNPNIYIWVNNDQLSDWAAALTLLVTGSTGVVTRDTTGIAAYTGGEQVNSGNSNVGIHFNEAGTASVSGDVTRAGISVPADHQTNSGKNVVIAFRRNK